jgi:hypothetical protein
MVILIMPGDTKKSSVVAPGLWEPYTLRNTATDSVVGTAKTVSLLNNAVGIRAMTEGHTSMTFWERPNLDYSILGRMQGKTSDYS